MSSALVKKLKPVSSSLDSLSYQFLQRCSVSGTAKGKGKIKAGQPLKRSKVTTYYKKRAAQDSSEKDGPRFLKPKEKAREAERDKMGLVSKGNEQGKHELKKLGKDFEWSFIMGTPGMDLISLGIVDADEIPKAESTLLRLKEEATEVLPEHLRAAALVPDLTPFPINRFMATLTPPIEGYIEKINEAVRKSSGKEKLR